jgi:hypothetical protein
VIRVYDEAGDVTSRRTNEGSREEGRVHAI